MDTRTSLGLSKRLAGGGCDVESEWYWVDGFKRNVLKNSELEWFSSESAICPAYNILNDIACKFAKEFFGEEYHCCICGEGEDGCYCSAGYYKAYQSIAMKILFLMQEGKKQKAEDYIWKHTVFNPKNGKGD